MESHRRPRVLLLLLIATLWTTSHVGAVEAASKAPNNGSATGGIVGGFAIGDMYNNFTCVSSCSCYLTDFLLSRFAVVCSGVSIRSIPPFLTEDLHQIESMTLTRTSIAQIDSLRMFSSLTYLNLNGSRVQSIDSGLVSTFPALEHLHLAENRLRQLNDFSIIQHLALRTVDVSANELTGFDRSGSMSLRELNLKRNLFATLNDLSTNYASLRRLDASENRLTLDGLSSWEPPTDLEVLDLSGNQLKSNSANATFLARLPQLQQLILTGNQLDSLSPIADWLPPGAKLWKLALSGNPLACTCGLYRDKEKLATQGVIIADSPSCRLANGSEFALTRLGSWACADGGGGGSGGGLAAAGGFGDLLQKPLVIALTAAVAVGLVCLAVGVGVCVCRRSSSSAQQLQQQQQQEAEYPYNTFSVKSTNLTGSQVSVATYRSNLPYGFDPQRSRVFTKKAGEQQQQQLQMGQRSQSEQILGALSSRGSTPLPPIPNSARVNSQQAAARPEDYSYVDMGSGGYQQIPEVPAPYTYDEVQMRQQGLQLPQPPPPPPPPLPLPLAAGVAVHEGYVDMLANAKR